MNLELKSSQLPVLGWCDVSVCPCYEQLEEHLDDGQILICNTSREFEDEELCTVIFYDDYSSKSLYTVFSGRVELIGRHIDHTAPLTYVFYPVEQVKATGIKYCRCCGEPEAAKLKYKKL